MEFKRIKSKNPVWDYFPRSRNGERAKCETCEKTISCTGGSTGGGSISHCLDEKPP